MARMLPAAALMVTPLLGWAAAAQRARENSWSSGSRHWSVGQGIGQAAVEALINGLKPAQVLVVNCGYDARAVIVAARGGRAHSDRTIFLQAEALQTRRDSLRQARQKPGRMMKVTPG